MTSNSPRLTSSFCLLPVLAFLASIGAASPLMAQTSSDTNSGPPPGTLLSRTPDRSAWSVVIQGSPQAEAPVDNNGTGSSASSGEQVSPSMSQSTVMKSGDTIYEQNKESDGRVDQIWHIKGLEVQKSPTDPTPTIGPDSGGEDIYSTDFQNSDFAGLDWISAQTYTGKTKYQGRDVMIFKQDLNPLPANVRRANDSAAALARTIAMVQAERSARSAPPGGGGAKSSAPSANSTSAKLVPAAAYIDLQTRLPLIVTIGGEKRTYQYAPLSQAIPMPPDVTKALSDYQQRIKLLSQ